MKTTKPSLRKSYGTVHFICKLLDIKDSNIQIMNIINRDTHKEMSTKLDYENLALIAGSQTKKYDFKTV